jgi:hypothetical protein
MFTPQSANRTLSPLGYPFELPMIKWKSVGIVEEGNPISIGGLNPWDFEWCRVQDEPVQLPHPSYPNQKHAMRVYEVESDGRRVRFAAGELSSNVWGFYIPAR